MYQTKQIQNNFPSPLSNFWDIITIYLLFNASGKDMQIIIQQAGIEDTLRLKFTHILMLGFHFRRPFRVCVCVCVCVCVGGGGGGGGGGMATLMKLFCLPSEYRNKFYFCGF